MNPEFLQVMSETACDMVKKIKDVKDIRARRGMMALLLTLCRNMEDVAARNASTKAQMRADELNLGDLRQYHWDDGGRFPGGRKSSRLHWEHWRPAVDLRNEMLSLEDPTPDQIKIILSTSRVCWILLDENDKLNSLGYRTNRVDPKTCYDEAGIELHYEW